MTNTEQTRTDDLSTMNQEINPMAPAAVITIPARPRRGGSKSRGKPKSAASRGSNAKPKAKAAANPKSASKNTAKARPQSAAEGADRGGPDTTAARGQAT